MPARASWNLSTSRAAHSPQRFGDHTAHGVAKLALPARALQFDKADVEIDE
jgi:hypothetical protein